MAVAVVGAGVTGLAAAHELVKRRPDLDVTLLEREPRVGGKILTEQQNGITYEAGADAFVARDPAILQLCADLQLQGELIPPAVFGAHIWSEGRMKAVPSDWAFGLPTSAKALIGSNFLPLPSKCRAFADLLVPGKLEGEDISIGELVRRRFGRELLERVVDPLLAGSRAGNADDISLAAAMAPVDSVARESASITRGLAAARTEGRLSSGPPPFLGLPGGMQRLVDALEASLWSTGVRMKGEATHIRPSEEGHYQIALHDGETVEADAVVVAAPSFAAADVLRSLSPEAARLLLQIPYSSSAVAVLVYEGGDRSIPPHGSGFLVPSRDHRILSACTWFSRKWPNAAPDDGRLVLRCFVGRTDRDASLALNDDDLIDLIDGEVRDALDLTAPLDSWKLYRWDRGLPVYRVGHIRLVEKITLVLAEHPGIELAGAAYRGSGIPDCVRQGEQAAARVLDLIGSRHG